mmetsp:Transcript_35346/g.105624  ORF Transcript_35346/g.105624 Transcript_35346/m.105624 type:complete len:280 (-) Transcript_35346:525-1364(-)
MRAAWGQVAATRVRRTSSHCHAALVAGTCSPSARHPAAEDGPEVAARPGVRRQPEQKPLGRTSRGHLRGQPWTSPHMMASPAAAAPAARRSGAPEASARPTPRAGLASARLRWQEELRLNPSDWQSRRGHTVARKRLRLQPRQPRARQGAWAQTTATPCLGSPGSGPSQRPASSPSGWIRRPRSAASQPGARACWPCPGVPQSSVLALASYRDAEGRPWPGAATGRHSALAARCCLAPGRSPARHCYFAPRTWSARNSLAAGDRSKRRRPVSSARPRRS